MTQSDEIQLLSVSVHNQKNRPINVRMGIEVSLSRTILEHLE